MAVGRHIEFWTGGRGGRGGDEYWTCIRNVEETDREHGNTVRADDGRARKEERPL